MNNNTNAQYKGVRGWLLFLCICLTILDPFSAFATLIAISGATKPYFEQQPGLFRLVLIGGICSTFLIVFSIYAGISLWKVVPNAVATAKRYLIAAFVYSLFSMFLPAIAGYSGESSPDGGGPSQVNNLIVMFYLSLWYLYLIRSRRVKATYGEGGEQRAGS